MKYKYLFYCYYNDIRVGKYKVDGDNFNELYQVMGKPLIMDGFKKGINCKLQCMGYKIFCDKIAKQVERCEKVRASDYLLFLSCYVSLVKYNKINDTEYLFIKRK